MLTEGVPLKVWETDGLVKAFAAGTLTEKQKLIYFLIWVLSGAVLFYLFNDQGNESPSWQTKIVQISISLSVTLAGTLAAYKANRDKKEFIERYACLSVPISFRLLIAVLAGFAAIGFFTGMSGHTEELNRFLKSNLYESGFSLIYGFAFYAYMARLFLKISDIKESDPPTAHPLPSSPQ
jgi:hypothetical protein